MTCTIRSLSAADLDAVQAIAAVSPEAPTWQSADYSLFVAGAPRTSPSLARAGFVGQTSSGEVLGFACASLLLDGQENRAELDTLAVLPAARRQGIGAALLRAVLAWAAGEGARRLSLEVRASNLAALGLYRRLGFGEEGRRRDYYADPVEDALLLGTPVTPGSSSDFFSTEDGIAGGASRC